MIRLTRLNGIDYYLNPELIEQVESTPDTVITLVTGNNFVVRNTLDDVLEKIFVYRKTVCAGQAHPAANLWAQRSKGKLKETMPVHGFESTRGSD